MCCLLFQRIKGYRARAKRLSSIGCHILFKDRVHIGLDALDKSVENPKTTISNSKRFIGLCKDDPAVIKDSKFIPYEIVNQDGKVAFKLEFDNDNDTKIVCPVTVASILLSKIKTNAENFLSNQ